MNHRLVINPDEAAQVRELFSLYLELGSMLAVVKEVNRRGWTTKIWVRQDGRQRDSGPWDKAKLQRVLTNVTYTGQVLHDGQILPGEHEAIIDQETFDRVQAQIQANGNGSSATVRNKHNALLRGLLYCGSCGAAMSHHYAKKGTRLYRYYRCVGSVKTRAMRLVPHRPSPPKRWTTSWSSRFASWRAIRSWRSRCLKRHPGSRRHRFHQLKAERTRLQRERQHNGEEIKRLVATIAAADKPSPSLTERLSELEESAASYRPADRGDRRRNGCG